MSTTIDRTQNIENTEGIEDEEERRRRQIEKNRAAIALLESWADVDEAGVQEQRETWEFLKRALDEDRLSDRKLFP